MRGSLTLTEIIRYLFPGLLISFFLAITFNSVYLFFKINPFNIIVVAFAIGILFYYLYRGSYRYLPYKKKQGLDSFGFPYRLFDNIDSNIVSDYLDTSDTTYSEKAKKEFREFPLYLYFINKLENDNDRSFNQELVRRNSEIHLHFITAFILIPYSVLAFFLRSIYEIKYFLPYSYFSLSYNNFVFFMVASFLIGVIMCIKGVSLDLEASRFKYLHLIDNREKFDGILNKLESSFIKKDQPRVTPEVGKLKSFLSRIGLGKSSESLEA